MKMYYIALYGMIIILLLILSYMCLIHINQRGYIKGLV